MMAGAFAATPPRARQCRQCQRPLRPTPEPTMAAAPNLGESYVLLPTTAMVSPRGGGVRPPFASLSQSMFLQEPWESTLVMPPTAIGAPPEPPRRAPTPAAMAESIIAVATHADVSEHIQRLNMYNAHCAGMPVTAPACKDCVDTMLKHIDSQAENARYEKRCFGSFLHSTGTSVRNEEIESINEKIRFYEEELRALEENLSMMEKERDEIVSRHRELDGECDALNEEEATLWTKLNVLHLSDVVFRDCRDAARSRMEAADRNLAVARAQNVLADAFVITQSGKFGSINGFRMGQLAGVHVEWNEINAGFGESALLLHVLASSLGLEFTDFKIVPLGSFSKIVRTTSVRMEYALHGSDQDNFAESYFNLGLGAWITCLAQVVSFVETQDHSIRLPYKISKHTIGGYSILYLKNKQAEWTKALRYALTTMKWLLTFLSTRSDLVASRS